jgi:hypothetical protein
MRAENVERAEEIAKRLNTLMAEFMARIAPAVRAKIAEATMLTQSVNEEIGRMAAAGEPSVKDVTKARTLAKIVADVGGADHATAVQLFDRFKSEYAMLSDELVRLLTE